MTKESLPPVHDRLDLTRSQEDYLKQIFLLGDGGGMVSTQDLADRLEVRPASATGMILRLADLGLVRHEPYRGVRLTESGRRVALEMLRHHRLIETFLERVLGYGWDEVHDEAERLEHVISERFEARIAETLGHPTHDPHGDPIPDADLRLPPTSDEVKLNCVDNGVPMTLTRVSSQSCEDLHLLGGIGLAPGAVVVVVGTGADGIEIRVNDTSHVLPAEFAEALWLQEQT
jgi:DtxR family Mn-dependent transcriptional regulator